MVKSIIVGSLLAFTSAVFAIPGHNTKPIEESDPVVIRVHESTGVAEALKEDGTWTVLEAVKLDDPRLAEAMDMDMDAADNERPAADVGTQSRQNELVHKSNYYGSGYGYQQGHGYWQGHVNPCAVPQLVYDPCGSCAGCQTYYVNPQQPLAYQAPLPPPIIYRRRPRIPPHILQEPPRLVRPYAVHRSGPYTNHYYQRYPGQFRRW